MSFNLDGSKTKKKQPIRLNIPGFITDDDIGLGDAIKRVTYAIGIKPCDGCHRRAKALNQLLILSPRLSKQRKP